MEENARITKASTEALQNKADSVINFLKEKNALCVV